MSALFACRALGEVLRADLRMRGERLDELVVWHPCDQLGRCVERVLDLREPLDEAGASLEELGELVGGQLPR